MINEWSWNNRRVLITGHTGFVGAWLSMVLADKGAVLYGLSLKPEPDSLYSKVSGSFSIESYECDLRDNTAVEKLIESIKPEIVFHLAAFGFIQECYADPYRAFSTNVDGTVNLLNAIRKCASVKSLVIASSDKVYNNDCGGETIFHRLFEETDPLGGNDPYSASKACQDIASRGFFDTYLQDGSIGMAIVRPSNILGGGDHHSQRLIPSVYRSLNEEHRVVIRHPDAVRPWQDILDMCDSYLRIAEYVYSRFDCYVYNVGPAPEGIMTVREIAETVASLYGLGSSVVVCSEENTTVVEKEYLGLSIEKIKRELNWCPKYSLYDTLKNVYMFYEESRDKGAYTICVEQIHDYYDRIHND